MSSSSSTHEALQALSELVMSADFKARRDAFSSRYCNEFVEVVDEGSGNKLSYTTIHNDYIADVEKDIVACIGQERLSQIMDHVEEYLREQKDQVPEEGIAVALDILSSMADFEHFKQMMLAKRDEQATGGTVLGMGGGSVIVDIEDELSKCADLLSASVETGWRPLAETDDMSVWIKNGGPGKRFVRSSLTIDLPPELAMDMLMTRGPEALEWNDRMSSIEVVADYGPDDKIVEVSLKVPWLMR
jgi:hypothetical protein